MTIYLSLLVCILGAFLYALAEKPKPQELGRGAYQCGLLAFLLQIVPHLIQILGR
jgi:hypothetical protein